MTSRAPSPPDADALLQAGALLPADDGTAATKARTPTVTVAARRYRHPALGERAVIRLTQDPLAEAEDLAMEFLGFARPEQASPPVARGRQRALGFPAAVILQDPKNARHALDVVKEMEKLSRLAVSKPGNAKDGYEEIANRLSRTVPHFLPSFFEQAGRAFIDGGNQSQAATMFGKAREAERTYHLPVDEERRRQAFLEFALSGALTAKALADYARDLSETAEPSAAYESFRMLCFQRTLGGLPPWTGMADEVHRMARAAGRDPAAEDAATITELVDAPASAKAAMGFWKPYAKTLIALAKDSPATRGRLLNLFPSPSGRAENFHDWWLELLNQCGALEALADPDSIPEEARAAGGPAAWVSRMAQHVGWNYWAPTEYVGLHKLLPRIAPSLRKEAVPVDVIGERGWTADINLLDLALELKIPVKEPEGDLRFGLDRWLASSPQVRRPLNFVGADERFRVALDRSIDGALNRNASPQLLSASGLHQPIRRWLTARVEGLSLGGLVTASDEIAKLEQASSGRVLGFDRSALDRLSKVDLAAALARTLRWGILDEFGWEALETARPKISPAKYQTALAGFAWPNLILADAAHAIVVAPDRIALTHDLRIPVAAGATASFQTPSYRFAGGQLLVMWTTEGKVKGYWSGRPTEVIGFPSAAHVTYQHGGEVWGSGISLELADGSRTYGGRAIHPGDTSIPGAAPTYSDGTTFWHLVRAERQGPGRLREYDPQNGQAGRVSLPSFFEDFVAEQWQLQPAASSIMPCPEGMTATPLGSRGGVVGVRIRTRVEGGKEINAVEGIDGRHFEGPVGAGDPQLGYAHSFVVGLLQFPGDAAPRPLATHRMWMGATVYDPSGHFIVARFAVGEGRPELARGTPLVPPPLYWHSFRVRDERGSLALRTITDENGRKLLQAARDESSGAAEAPQPTPFGFALRRAGSLPVEKLPKTQALIGKLLPEVTHQGLREGVTGVCQYAAHLARRLETVLAEAAEAAPLPATPAASTPAQIEVSDGQLRQALSGLLERHGYTMYGGGRDLHRPLTQIVAVSETLSPVLSRRGLDIFKPAQKKAPNIEESGISWPDFGGHMAAIAFRAISPATPPDEREALLQLLRIWADTPFAAHPDWCRTITAKLPANSSNPAFGRSGGWMRKGGNAYFVRPADTVWQAGQTIATHTILELAEKGHFATPSGVQIMDEERWPSGWATADRLRAFEQLARGRGPIAWDADAVPLLVSATGMTHAEAALLLAALPRVGSTEHNFLPKDTRELLGLKATEAAAARSALATLTVRQRLSLLEAAMPERAEPLWEQGALHRVAERIADAYTRALGRRVALDEDMVLEAEAALKTTVKAQAVLAMFADPDRAAALHNDADWFIGPHWQVARVPGEPAFDGGLMDSIATAVPWIFGSVPVGHPIRANLPKVVELANRRVRNPNLLVSLGWHDAAAVKAALSHLGAKPYRPPKGQSSPGAVQDGGLMLSLVQDQGTPPLFGRPAAAIGNDIGWVSGLLGPDHAAALLTAQFLAQGAAAMAERVTDTPVPPGGWEANPIQSCPELVKEVEAALSLEEDAAILYLQVLALHEPTSKNLGRWNGWSPTRLKKASAALVQNGLVVEGTRARAGRAIFLPGHWVELKAPNLPLEAWKLPLYEITMEKNVATFPLDRVVALRPLHDVFKAAWDRLKSGDRPGFEAVSSGKPRR
jgi:hypothetical protein